MPKAPNLFEGPKKGLGYNIETLPGGIPHLVIEGNAENDCNDDMFKALSQLSRKHDQILVNILGLKGCPPSFFKRLFNLSSKSKFKVISSSPEMVKLCEEIEVSTFPTVKSAVLAYIGDETIKLMLKKMTDVPILRSDAYSLVSYISRPEASFDNLEKMVEKHPGLVSQIFRMANSAFFRRESKVETLKQAFVTMGISALRQIFIYNFYHSVGNIFQAQSEVIQHGQKCATLAEFISRSAGSPPEEYEKVRMGGLLHDIGSQALAFFFPDHYEKVRKIMKEKNQECYLAELLVFGTEHQSVGVVLCKKWNFPEYLGAVIGDHHYLQNEEWNNLTLPIFCANNFLVSQTLGLSFSQFFKDLERFFFLKKREIPWKDISAEFNKVLESKEDLF
ncbi:HDOD domain-containing protein [bacterium]|nr:HDOD domain-containing protein [bacterium]